MKKEIVFLLSLLLSANFLCSRSENVQDKINMYTFYTPSHEVFHDLCIGTLKDDGVTVITKTCSQECPSGNVFTKGWDKTMLYKVDMIIDAIKKNWGNVFIYSDTDIQFFQPISKRIMTLIGDKDLVIQRDTPSGTVCAGFFACRANERTLALWEGVRSYMIENKVCSDQKTLNRLLRKGNNKERNRYEIIWDYLPVEFLSGGTMTGRPWSAKARFFIPRDIVLHHANWTTGVDNKLVQLAFVRKKVEKMNSSVSV